MTERPDDAQAEVADFFNRQQADSSYENLKPLVALQDKAAAEVLNKGLKGTALSIGGVWQFFEKGPQVRELTVLDLSEGMLDRARQKAAEHESSFSNHWRAKA